MLYPRRDDLVYHQDHLHPQSLCQKLPKELRQQCNYLANLQLLHDRKNQKKSAMPLKDWVLQQHENNLPADPYLPENVSMELSDCQEFWEARKKKMLSQLRQILGIKKTQEM